MSQALIFRGERRFELVETESEPGPGEVQLEVVAAGICGSDVHGYAGVNDRRPPGTVMGHEVTGRVAGTGELVAVWPIVAWGECDLCLAARPHLCRARRIYGCVPELPGGFATRMVVPAANLVPVPANVPAEWGAFAEPLAVGEHAVAIAGGELGDRVGVIGGGPIGIAVSAAASRRGVQRVIVTEPIEARRRVLAELGLEAVPPEQAPRDLETVFDCVGLTATLRAAVEATRPGGTVVCVGLAEPELAIASVALVVEERRLLGSSAYTRDDFAAAAASLAELDLGPVVGRRTDLSGAPAAFEAYATGTETAVKTLVVPLE